MARRIHIIDDDRTTQILLRAALEKRGFDVTVSDDSYHVFDLVDSLPDLFLLDVIVPGINGFEVCKWLKAEHPNTRIIILSGTPGLKVLAEGAHADDFLAKPFEISTLLQKVKHVLESPNLDAVK